MESNISNHIKMTADVYPADISIPADYVQIEQILINLIKNAADALSGKENGMILMK